MDMKNQEVGRSLIKEHESNKVDRSEWTESWEECSYYGVPRKNNMYGQRTKGSKVTGSQLFTAYAIWCIDFVASAFHGMLTNPASIWFGLTSGIRELDQNDNVRVWLDEVVHRMIDTLNGSNFQTEIHETYIDLASSGTNVLKMEEDEEDVINFQSIPPYRCTIGEDKRGDVKTVSREYEFNIYQIIEEFGELPEEIKRDMGNELQEKFVIIHVIKPRKRAELQKQLDIGGKELPKSMKYVSYHILQKSAYILELKGFKEAPYAVPRWSKTSDEKYGRSPLMKALADVKLLNSMQKVTIQGAQLKIAPPVESPDNGFLRPLNLKPYGVNYRRATTKMETRPIFTGADPGIGLEIMDSSKGDIKQHFYIDQLRMIVADRMTATEVIQRRDEQLRTLGPILGRLHRELLKPIIDRLFGLMLDKGLLPPIPEELGDLKGGKLKIKYTSAIAKAQITSEAENIVRAIESTSVIIQAQPEVLDLIDGDKLLKYNWEIFGAPTTSLRSGKEVEEIRKARAEAQQKMEQQEDQTHEAESINKMAPAAKE